MVKTEQQTAVITKMAKKMNRGYFQHLLPKVDHGYSKAMTSPMDHKRSKRRPPLTPEEKLDIVHKVLV